MEVRQFDAIIVGLGGMGSATAWRLARLGLKVLGIERFTAAHDRGSSHGETRAIRQAYFEDPAYVPLVRSAYALWSELETQTGSQLLHRVGLLQVGRTGSELIDGARKSAIEHHLPLDSLEVADVATRYPQFRIPEGTVSLYERNAGFLRVEACVAASLAAAESAGAHLLFETTMYGWQARPSHFVVATSQGEFAAPHLVWTCGPWAAKLLAPWGCHLRLVLKNQYWFDVESPEPWTLERSPVFFFDLEGDFYYGFPSLDGRQIKVAEHSGGEEVSVTEGALPVPSDEKQRLRVEAFVERQLRFVHAQSRRSAACWYTISPDGHFLVDQHPQHANLHFIAGLSGHGFKFAPALGEIIARRITGEPELLDTDFLRIGRLTRR